MFGGERLRPLSFETGPMNLASAEIEEMRRAIRHYNDLLLMQTDARLRKVLQDMIDELQARVAAAERGESP